MNPAKWILLTLLLPAIGSAGQKPQFVLEVAKAIQSEHASSYYVPGSPSQSRTSCNGTSNASGNTSTLDANCTTTTSPGSPARSGTRYVYSEDIRVIMPDGSHLTLWCQEGYRTCLHLAAGKYSAERDKDTIWIYCTFANQDNWSETGMSPGQRKASHTLEKIKYRVVGTWKDEPIAVGSNEPTGTRNQSKGLDAGLMMFANLTNDTSAAASSFDISRRPIQNDEVRCGEPFFGEAFVCKATDTSTIIGTVATRTPHEIYRYWLEKISDDYLELKRVSTIDCKEKCADATEFVTALEKANQDRDSVWMKLKVAYCKDTPTETYMDIDGQRKRCDN